MKNEQGSNDAQASLYGPKPPLHQGKKKVVESRLFLDVP